MSIWETFLLLVVVAYFARWAGEIAGAWYAQWEHDRKNGR
jgi:hypothetical protein